MNRSPVALLIISLAMLLAPMGVCVAKGHVQIATATAPAHDGASAHGGASRDHGHSGRVEKSRHHFCSDCQPPDSLSASKAGAGPGPAIVPATVAIVARVEQGPAARDSVLVHNWYGRAPPIPPPLPSAAKVRLQI